MKKTNSLFTGMPTTVFAVMSALANEHKAVNLGQGFPDIDGPEWVRQEAANAIMNGQNQYAPLPGLPDLRQAVAEDNKRFYDLDINPDTEILITAGATEALLCSFMGLLNQGDEAIIIEPFYDSYPSQVMAAGGKPVYVRLEAPDFKLDIDKLRAAFSEKTKLLVLNSPMNPIGKVFSKEELQAIAMLVMEFDIYVVCDEVYEHLLFDGKEHIPLMTLDGMRQRCIRIGSAGKTFSLTGWKIGYMTIPEKLRQPIMSAHQFITFVVATPLQAAVAKGLRAGEDYYHDLEKQMDEGRLYLRDGLKDIGFDVLPCDGTYFLSADFSAFDFKGDDYEFCKYITAEAGVAAIPLSPFYAPENGAPPSTMIRFCFAKKRDVLEEGLTRLGEFFK